MKELDWNQINQEVVRIHNSNPGRKLCIFFDENIGIEPDVGLIYLYFYFFNAVRCTDDNREEN